jgi:GT2 family glycosyltransferase
MFSWRTFMAICSARPGALLKRARSVFRDFVLRPNYNRWIARHETLTQTDRQKICNDIGRFPRRPVISVIMPVAGADRRCLQTTIRSMQTQLYPYWELCCSADASVLAACRAALRDVARQDHRIRCAFREDTTTWATKANAALLLASGDFVAPLDPGDTLAEDALYRVAKEILEHSDTRLFFSDEDKIERNGIRVDPWFKPDWNLAIMLSCNTFGRLGVYDRTLVKSLGGFRFGYDGAEEHDVILRCAREINREQIRHIPRILYHRRYVASATCGSAKSAKWEAGRRAIAQYLVQSGFSASVGRGRTVGYQVTYQVPLPHPRVSIIIATTARPALLKPCLDSLLKRTSYGNFEVLLLVNEGHTRLSERADLLRRLTERSPVRVLAYPDQPFNYSWVNNWGAGQVSSDVLCFLNDDTEVITGDWLHHLVGRVSLPGVAAAGPMLYYSDDTIQHAGVILGLGGVAGHACHGEPMGAHGYFGRACLEQDVSCVTAACMAIRHEVFHELGGFDEALPIAYNDVDLCIRLRKAGWRIIWTPMVELYHHESASIGRHDSGPRAEQFSCAVALMRQRWGSILDSDPFYNRNLSLERPYKLAFPPREAKAAVRPPLP